MLKKYCRVDCSASTRDDVLRAHRPAQLVQDDTSELTPRTQRSLSRAMRAIMRGGEDVRTGSMEAQVDQAPELWGITDKKLQEIRGR